MPQPFRIQPKLPSQAMKTYQIVAPVSTHWRPATCAEAECANYTHGWRTQIDEGTELGKKQAYYIRNKSGRHFTEDRGELTTFNFEAGQKCFTSHQLRLDRESLYLVKDGDWRASTNRRQHSNGDDWVDDFTDHQQRLADEIEKG